MSEAALWDTLRVGMGGLWHAQRHEDKHSTSIPDVSYAMGSVDGWIELKYMNEVATARSLNSKTFDFHRDHFPEEQRNWLTERARRGAGNVFVICRFDGYLHKDGRVTAIWLWRDLSKSLGRWSMRSIIEDHSAAWWSGSIHFGELTRVLYNRGAGK